MYVHILLACIQHFARMLLRASIRNVYPPQLSWRKMPALAKGRTCTNIVWPASSSCESSRYPRTAYRQIAPTCSTPSYLTQYEQNAYDQERNVYSMNVGCTRTYPTYSQMLPTSQSVPLMLTQVWIIVALRVSSIRLGKSGQLKK